MKGFVVVRMKSIGLISLFSFFVEIDDDGRSMFSVSVISDVGL